MSAKSTKKIDRRTKRKKSGLCPNKGYKWIPAKSNSTNVFLDNQMFRCKDGKCGGKDHILYRWKVRNNNDEGGYLDVFKEGYRRIGSSKGKVGGVVLYKQKYSCSKCDYVNTGTSRNTSIYRIKNEVRC